MAEPATPPSPSLSERRMERVSLCAEVSLRRSGQNNYRVAVFDISPLGCKIEFVERPDVDEYVWIKFDGLEALEAQVCWVAGFKAGVAFSSPIHPAVFGMLVGRIGRRDAL
jgi:PilZ domain